MTAQVVHLFNFDAETTTATVDLGSARPFLAWCSITFTDALDVYDADDGACIEVYQVDRQTLKGVAKEGKHLGPEGDDANLRPGAVRGNGRYVTFRMRTFDLDVQQAGVGTIITL